MAKDEGTDKAFRDLERKAKKEAKEREEKSRQKALAVAKKEQAKKKLIKRLVLAAVSLVVVIILGTVVYVNADSIGKMWKSVSGPSKKKGKVNCSYLQNQDRPECTNYSKSKKKKGSSFSFAP